MESSNVLSSILSVFAYGYAMWALAINASAFLMNFGEFGVAFSDTVINGNYCSSFPLKGSNRGSMWRPGIKESITTFHHSFRITSTMVKLNRSLKRWSTIFSTCQFGPFFILWWRGNLSRKSCWKLFRKTWKGHYTSYNRPFSCTRYLGSSSVTDY